MVFGAAHIPAVVDYLTGATPAITLGYSARWLDRPPMRPAEAPA